MKKSPSFQNVDIFPELDRCTPCVFIGTVARFSRNKSLLISFGAPVVFFTGTLPNYIMYVKTGLFLSKIQLQSKQKANIASFCNSFFKPMFINNAYRPNPN